MTGEKHEQCRLLQLLLTTVLLFYEYDVLALLAICMALRTLDGIQQPGLLGVTDAEIVIFSCFPHPSGVSRGLYR